MLTHALWPGICLRAAADTRMYSVPAAPFTTRILMAPVGATAPFTTRMLLVFSANELAAESTRPDPMTVALWCDPLALFACTVSTNWKVAVLAFMVAA
jgi:hypothetical protein